MPREVPYITCFGNTLTETSNAIKVVPAKTQSANKDVEGDEQSPVKLVDAVCVSPMGENYFNQEFMDLKTVMRRLSTFAYSTSGTIEATTEASDKFLWFAHPVRPQFANLCSLATVPTAPAESIFPTWLGWYSLLFQYWRGSMVYDYKVNFINSQGNFPGDPSFLRITQVPGRVEYEWPGWRFGHPNFSSTQSDILNKPFKAAQALASGGVHFDKNGHARVEAPYYSKFERLFTQSTNPSTKDDPNGFQKQISLTDSIGMVYIRGHIYTCYYLLLFIVYSTQLLFIANFRDNNYFSYLFIS